MSLRVKTTTKAMVGAAAVLAVSAVAATRSDGYLSCGHKCYFYERLISRSHCCSHASEVVMALSQLHGGQELFRLQHGSFAGSLTQLTNFVAQSWPLSLIRFRATSNDWSCLVARTGDLPGSYLLRSDGKIYFSDRSQPETNSLLLRDNVIGYSIGQ